MTWKRVIVLNSRPVQRNVERGGFTLIELLVVISIISILASLILPAVQSARESARRMTCASNIRQLALAIHNDASSTGRLPAAGNFGIRGEQYHSWATALLGYLDRPDLNDRYDRTKPYTETANKQLTHTHLNVLTCPNDFSVVEGKGNLSFVVNAGFAWTIPVDCPATMHLTADNVLRVVPFDLNGNQVMCPLDPTNDGAPSDRALLFDLSVFFLENLPLGTGTTRHHSLDTITDGTGHTILLTENIRAGYDAVDDASWGSPEIRHNSFLISSYVCANESCSPGNVDYRLANDRQPGPARQESINSSITQPEGGAPWPSSMHAGIINVAFCDGHVKSISTAIDGAVYAALVTPRGARLTGPLGQHVLSDTDY